MNNLLEVIIMFVLAILFLFSLHRLSKLNSEVSRSKGIISKLEDENLKLERDKQSLAICYHSLEKKLQKSVESEYEKLINTEYCVKGTVSAVKVDSGCKVRLILYGENGEEITIERQL